MRILLVFALAAVAAGNDAKLQQLRESVLADNRAGNTQSALEKSIEAMKTYPTEFVFLEAVVITLGNNGQHEQVLQVCDNVLKLDPENFLAHFARGRSLGKDPTAAVAAFSKSLELIEAAGGQIGQYRTKHIQFELGNAYRAQGDTVRAADLFRQAVKLDPNFHEGWMSVGMTSRDLDEAHEAYLKTTQLAPKLAMGWSMLGQSYFILYKKDKSYMKKAEEALLTARKLDSTLGHALYILVHINVVFSNWPMLEDRLKEMSDMVDVALNQHTLGDNALLWVQLLVYPLPDDLLVRIFRRKAELLEGLVSQLRSPVVQPKTTWAQSGPFTVGYMSADFKNHPVAFIFQAVPELHNRSVVSPAVLDIWMYGGGESVERNRIKAGVDKWIDLTTEDYSSAALKIQENKVDVLVDMNGHHLDGRPHIAVLRPAPISVLLYGFPASTQGSYIDYIATDTMTSPPEFRADYSEKMLYMGLTYWPVSHKQARPELAKPDALPALSRKEAGVVRAKGVLFACFNQNLKVTAELFDVWMRILHRVPNSMLWFVKLGEGVYAEPTLKKMAKVRGISPSRIIMTDSAPYETHLQHKSVADILLDTHVYNSHSTGIDALFAGVPMITLPARRMAARVGAALDAAHNVSNLLVVRDLTDYEEVAVRLALNPKKLAAIKKLVIENRDLPKGLFDTAHWVDRWERTLKMAVDLNRNGIKPHHVVLST